MLTVRDLVYDYPGHRALDHISFEIAPRTITALVGPNGAGKSTLMKVCAALDRPFAGSVHLQDLDIHSDPREAHRRMGFLPDFYGLYEELTVAQCLEYRASAQGVSRPNRAGAIRRSAERLEIANRLDQRAGELSRGLKQRLAIAQATIHDPTFLLLDEPASGLDPEARIGLAAVLRTLQGEGMTIVVSSHILAELEDYSTHILMIRGGEIVEHAPIGEIGKPIGNRINVVIELARPDPRLDDVLSGFPEVDILQLDGTRATIAMSSAIEARHQLLRALLKIDLPVVGFAAEKHRLQEAYMARMKLAAERGK